MESTHARHWWVLGALLGGLVTGTILEQVAAPAGQAVGRVIESIGMLWLNALRMTVAPLVFALLVSAVGGVADAMATGRLATRAVTWFAALLVLAGVVAIALSLAWLALWPVDSATAADFVAGAARERASTVAAMDWSQFLQALVPSNVFAAAADNAILALVVFATLLGFATTRLAEPLRNTLLRFFTALAEAMVVIVHWVLWLAPLGVFALALGVGRQAGLRAAGLLLHYAIFVALVIALATLLLYLVVALRRPTWLGRFVRELAPVQVVAASTQSSLATLPAMIECARDRLGVAPRVAHLLLPLAVAVFRYTSPIGNLAVCMFIATLYGIEPSPLQFGVAIAVAFAISVGTVGLPGQVSFVASVAPICAALGLPIDLLGILVAVEILPDIFRTIGNVTADLAVAVVVDTDPGTADEATPTLT